MGRRMTGRANEAIPAMQFGAIATKSMGAAAERVPQSTLGREVGRTRLDRYTNRPLDIALSEELTAAQLSRVYAHEIGHVIDQLAGEIPTANIKTELKIP